MSRYTSIVIQRNFCFSVGARPDDFVITRNCRHILVGLEGGPYTEPALDGSGGDISVDPEGYLLKLRFKSSDLTKAFVKRKIDFSAFDSR